MITDTRKSPGAKVSPTMMSSGQEAFIKSALTPVPM